MLEEGSCSQLRLRKMIAEALREQAGPHGA